MNRPTIPHRYTGKTATEAAVCPYRCTNPKCRRYFKRPVSGRCPFCLGLEWKEVDKQ